MESGRQRIKNPDIETNTTNMERRTNNRRLELVTYIPYIQERRSEEN